MGKKKGKNFKKNNNYSTFWIAPVLFIIAVVPLIMRAIVIELTEVEQIYFFTDSLWLDVFSYWKSIWFVVSTLISLTILLYLHWQKKIQIQYPKWLIIPLSIYLFFSLISFLNAKDLTIAFRGFVQIHQGLFVVLSYGLIIFISYNLFTRKKDFIALIYSLYFLWFVAFIIAITQFFGNDIFNSEFIQRLILPRSLHNLIGNFRPSAGRVYITMFNSNFVGSYSALMLPISISILLSAKNLKSFLISSPFVAMNFFVWLASSARSGLMGIIVTFIIFIPLWFFQIKRKPPVFIISVAVGFLLLFLISYSYTDGRIITEFNRLTLSGEGRVVNLEDPDIAYFEEINIDEFSLEVITNRESIILNLSPQSGFVQFTTIEGTPLATNMSFSRDNINYEISSNNFDKFVFQLNTVTNNLRVTAYQRTFNFLLTEEGFMFDGVGGFSSYLENAPRVRLLDGYERIASSRGYIWSRSIPMLRDTIFIGYGPDMYVANFPQRDLSGRLNGFTLNAINDKPHNMFLQIGINVGVIALFALMFIYGFYFLETAKIYWKRRSETFEEYLGLGIATGIFAYLVAGLFNDQIISLAPAFYALTGIGLALNRMIKISDDSRSNNLLKNPSKV